jgi:hypothetical protein
MYVCVSSSESHRNYLAAILGAAAPCLRRKGAAAVSWADQGNAKVVWCKSLSRRSSSCLAAGPRTARADGARAFVRRCSEKLRKKEQLSACARALIRNGQATMKSTTHGL